MYPGQRAVRRVDRGASQYIDREIVKQEKPKTVTRSTC